MSSSADDAVAASGKPCQRCGERPAFVPWLMVVGITLLTLGLFPFHSRLCAGCTARTEGLALFAVCAGVVVWVVLIALFLS